MAAAIERALEAAPILREFRSRRAGNLSGGQQRLLEIQRALITDPELLLVDEPTVGLDPKITSVIYDHLRRLCSEEGRTILMVDQNVIAGTAVADYIYVLELGANDGLRGLDPAATYVNLDAIIARFVEEGLAVLIAGMLAPPNLGREYGVEFNAAYPRLAEKYNLALYPFFLDGVALQPELNQPDGIHPNAEGARIVAENVWRALEPLLRR